MPTLAKFAGYKAELQIRTVAQHLWAASSHVLQYKQELSVPPPVRRSIHRVSALLETVDLEFERVLLEREQYSKEVDINSSDETLNVDLLEKILNKLLPKANRRDSEPYSDLLSDLFVFGVMTPQALEVLIKDNEAAVLEEDAERVQAIRADKNYTGTSKDRIDRGVFYTHVGLVRGVLTKQFGSRWESYIAAKFSPVSQLKISPAANAVLAGAKIAKIIDLAVKPESELLSLPGMTDPILSEIKEKLNARGIALGMPRIEAIIKMSSAASK